MNTVAKPFQDLRQGDVIVRHPKHGHPVAYRLDAAPIDMPFTDPPESVVDYRTPDGGSGRLVLRSDTVVQLQAAPAAEGEVQA